ncbi:C-type lectin domain family 4 member M-like isoform X1 [Palaemon carinicauda]|uniref:C-type lectin domain family 4 member M-like isoform X1 n=1 Tax=Palaemon carinicauda TaxID=392227 RepID=UPI0035B68AE6
MADQLVNFSAHYLPPSSPSEASPLLNNSLLQTSFLMQHILLPTLYAALTATSFRNKTKNRRFQEYLTSNNQVIDAINQNLTDLLRKSALKDGRLPDDDTEERCRRKRNLGYSITAAQETLVDLQEAVARKMLQKSPLDQEARGLLESMLPHMQMQRENLRKIKAIQMKADEEEEVNKRSTSVTCKEPYHPVGSECFLVVHERKLGWREAISACQELRGYLAEPSSPKQLVRFLKTIEGHFNRAWIGGSDEEEEGNWKWLSGRPLTDSEDWRPGQPSNYSRKGEAQHCLVVLRHTRSGSPPLADFSCWVDRAYVCETEPEC